MIIRSDWHIHTNNSYDASLPLETIAEGARKLGLKNIGITDHLNLNDAFFKGCTKASVKNVKELNDKYPEIIPGVELTPIDKPQFDFIAKNGTNKGMDYTGIVNPYDKLELAMSKDELMEYGVRYGVGGAHWAFGLVNSLNGDKNALSKEYLRQMLFLASDERVTILAHPWWNGPGVWFDDFSQIPRSMNMELAAALKENKKYVECNQFMLTTPKATEKFKKQYAEFIRELFEMGIPVTFGSDSHNTYAEHIDEAEKLLSEVGFTDGEFSNLDEKDFWF